MNASGVITCNDTNIINNEYSFLRENSKIALSCISLHNNDINNKLYHVNVYCNCIDINKTNLFGILKTINIFSQEENLMYRFNKKSLIFHEFKSLNAEIKITVDFPYIIDYFQIIYKDNNEQYRNNY